MHYHCVALDNGVIKTGCTFFFVTFIIKEFLKVLVF